MYLFNWKLHAFTLLPYIVIDGWEAFIVDESNYDSVESLLIDMYIPFNVSWEKKKKVERTKNTHQPSQ